MNSVQAQAFGGAVADELAAAIGALVDSPVGATPDAPAAGAHVAAEIAVSGAADGACAIAFDAAGAAALAARVANVGSQAPPEAVIGTVRDVLDQALSALSMSPAARGARFTLESIRQVPELDPSRAWSARALRGTGLPVPVKIACWADVFEAAPRAISPSRPAPAAASGPAASDRLNVILDIDLPLTVRFGRTELPLKSLTRIGPGSLIDLGRSPEEPVEVLVSNRVVARGEVVIVSGNYGVRILDVVSPRERARTLEE